MDYSTIQAYVQDGLIGLFVILAGTIKIPKIELNLWAIIFKKLGNALNRDVLERVDRLSSDFEKHLKDEEIERVNANRRRILKCEGELRRAEGKSIYSKEAFDELLKDITCYKKYCSSHPEYENAKAVLAVEYIQDTYTDYMKGNKFLK